MTERKPANAKIAAMPDAKQNQRFSWLISRVRRLFLLWDYGLESPEKNYVLRRIRDKEPELFYGIANERK